jgi:hypothetical protein
VLIRHIDSQTRWEHVTEVSVREKPSHHPIDLAIPGKAEPAKPFAFFTDDADPSSKELTPEPEPQAHVEGPTPSNPVAPSETVRKPDAKPRYAIVTSVWDYKYSSLALMLGWSIKQHNDLAALGAELVLLTLHGGHLGDAAAPGITSENQTRLEKVGWKIRKEEHLKVPSVNFSLIQPHRRLNLNKLKIFGWTEYDKIVFMDADTLVKGPIDDLFAMPGEFAAAPDSWWNNPLDFHFNSGVMVLKPRRWIFENMIEKLGDPKYHDPTEGDQAFLQKYWEYKNWGLPAIYNLNLVLHENFRKTWDHLWTNTRIVHFTVQKPKEAWSPGGQCGLKTGKSRSKTCGSWIPLAVSPCSAFCYSSQTTITMRAN